MKMIVTGIDAGSKHLIQKLANVSVWVEISGVEISGVATLAHC